MGTIMGYAGKILMIGECEFIEDRRIYPEAKLLAQNNYKISVISLSKKNTKFREIVDGIIIYTIPKITIFEKGIRKPKNKFLQYINMFKKNIGYIIEYIYFTSACFLLSPLILFKDGFDVIHAHNPPDTLFIIGKLYKLFGKKFVFDHHDLSPELYLSRFGVQNGTMHRALLMVEKLACKTANVVIATNESYKKINMERNKVNAENIFIVRNGPDLERIKLSPPNPRLKAMNKKIFGYIGEINPQDGLDYLLRAIRHLVYDFGRKDFYCVIIGTGDAWADLVKLKSEFQLDDYVWFTNFIPDKDAIQYLSTADICLDPDPSSPLNDASTWIKIMEYMALGKPIVTFDLKETRITAQDAAIYVPPNNEIEFAKAIIKLMDNPDLRAKMGEYGQKRIREKLAWHHVSKNLLLAYKHLSL